MSLRVDPQFSPLTYTEDNLADMARFIEEKNIVVLHAYGTFRIFHALSSDPTPESLANVRVLYVDCKSNPKRLEVAGAWERFINTQVKGVQEIALGNALGRTICHYSVPHSDYLVLGD